MKKQPRILAVDDEKPILEVIKAYLEKEGFRVMTAEGGVRFIETVYGMGCLPPK
ncbi:MAG: hypothetical protein LBG72_05220 [Spirochaetaceae bacterium]|jgi:DNA-binding response OmpR family regulator|nr:hypothetical protein [Spirochaetaceae bacterium]